MNYLHLTVLTTATEPVAMAATEFERIRASPEISKQTSIETSSEVAYRDISVLRVGHFCAML